MKTHVMSRGSVCLVLMGCLMSFVSPASASLAPVEVLGKLVIDDDGLDDLITVDFDGVYNNTANPAATLDVLQVNLANSSPELLVADDADFLPGDGFDDNFTRLSFSDPSGRVSLLDEFASFDVVNLTFFPGVLAGSSSTLFTINVDTTGLAPGDYTLDVSGGLPGFDDTVGGTFAPTGGVIPVFFVNADDASVRLTVEADQPTPAVVPEPATAGLGLLAVAGLVARVRRRPR